MSMLPVTIIRGSAELAGFIQADQVVEVRHGSPDPASSCSVLLVDGGEHRIKSPAPALAETVGGMLKVTAHESGPRWLAKARARDILPETAPLPSGVTGRCTLRMQGGASITTHNESAEALAARLNT